jgi:hypothetical protein
MNAQLKYMIVGRRGGELTDAKPMANRPAVRQRRRVEVDDCLRGPGAFGCGGCGFGARGAGHQLGCRATVTYPLPFRLTATATSAAITIGSATLAPLPLPPPPPSTPALSSLSVSPRTFTRRGRRVRGRCQPASRSNRGHRPCARRAALTVHFTLNTSATTTLALQLALPGRLARSRCTPPTRSDRRHRRCTRLALLPGTISLPGVAGVNWFTLAGAIGGHTLEPGRYRLLATPAIDERAGNQRQTTFHITR